MIKVHVNKRELSLSPLLRIYYFRIVNMIFITIRTPASLPQPAQEDQEAVKMQLNSRDGSWVGVTRSRSPDLREDHSCLPDLA